MASVESVYQEVYEKVAGDMEHARCNVEMQVVENLQELLEEYCGDLKGSEDYKDVEAVFFEELKGEKERYDWDKPFIIFNASGVYGVEVFQNFESNRCLNEFFERVIKVVKNLEKK